MIRKLLLIIALGMMGLVLINCKSGGDPELSETQIQLSKLVSTWNSTSAVRDGVSQAGYDNFRITISANTGTDNFKFTSAGRPALSPWPASGSGSFGTNVGSDLLLDTTPVSYSVTDTELMLTFVYSGVGYPARTSGVTGTWVFRFSK